VITVRRLDKAFGPVHAVRTLSFDVRAGVVTGFLGPNGAGKSTTMRLMLQLVTGRGVTRFGGRVFRDLPRPLRVVGTVLDARAFHPTRTARDHLRMIAASAGLPASRADEVLGIVGLEEVAGEGPGRFSLGMCQRLALAAALLGDPEYLILDEPANGLDPQGIQWLRELLREQAAQGRCVLVSSHLLAEMALMADDLVVVGAGRLIASGPVQEFVDRFTSRLVAVRSPQAPAFAGLLGDLGWEVRWEPDGTLLVAGAEPPAIGDLAARYQITLHELSTRSASLEQAFLEATSGATRLRSHDEVPM
jgi:ABC-2 type transport system ATP-binding protein